MIVSALLNRLYQAQRKYKAAVKKEQLLQDKWDKYHQEFIESFEHKFGSLDAAIEDTEKAEEEMRELSSIIYKETGISDPMEGISVSERVTVLYENEDETIKSLRAQHLGIYIKNKESIDKRGLNKFLTKALQTDDNLPLNRHNVIGVNIIRKPVVTIRKNELPE